MNIFYINGQFVDEENSVIDARDLSVIRGYGVFDFLRTYNGCPFHLHDHILRLERSAKLINLRLPHPVAEIEAIVRETLAKNDHPESNIRIVVTGGNSQDGITPADNPRLLVMVTPVTTIPEESYTRGIKVITSHVERFMPGAKTINYVPAILCQAEAKNRNAVEAIYVDRSGYLLEGTTSNFFVVKDNKLITPPTDRVLPGITRQVVLELCKGNFDVEIRNLHQDELRLLDEAFLASSVREVVPVVTVDAITIGNGKPGPQTERARQLFTDYAKNYQS